MNKPPDAGKYQVDNDEPVQGQVIGDHNTIEIHFHGEQDTTTSSPKPKQVWDIPYAWCESAGSYAKVTSASHYLSFVLFALFSLIPAASGGFLWSTLNRVLGLDPTIGGPFEPHGVAAFFWPIVTNGPTVVILVILGQIYRSTNIRHQLRPYLAFLFFGLPFGSLIFYDLPLSGRLIITHNFGMLLEREESEGGATWKLSHLNGVSRERLV